MNVTLESSGNLLIAYLFGEIDHHTAVAVRSQIDSAIQDKLPGHLILILRMSHLWIPAALGW